MKLKRKTHSKFRIIESIPKTEGSIKWELHDGKGTGYLDNYLCDPRSEEYPVRDVRDHKNLNKKEPHYEDLTFNKYRKCNLNLLNAALKRKDSYIFFFTRYLGLKKEWRRKCLITGYYLISHKGWVNDNKPRWSVKAETGKFVHVKDGYPLENLLHKEIKNVRYGRGPINAKQIQILLSHFSQVPDMTKNYTEFTKILRNS